MFNFFKPNFKLGNLCTAPVTRQSYCRYFKQSNTRYPVCEHDHLNICRYDAVDHVCELMEGLG
jgi:hypothetical protein